MRKVFKGQPRLKRGSAILARFSAESNDLTQRCQVLLRARALCEHPDPSAAHGGPSTSDIELEILSLWWKAGVAGMG